LNSGRIVDFASRSVHEMASKAKVIIAAYYGDSPTHSYWNGCSTGGHEGLMEAQRSPGDFDGILAGSPAINWDRMVPALLWPQIVMKDEAGGPIATAKLNLATNAAIAACDALDGVVDGVLTDPRSCSYSATALVTNPCTTNTCLTAAQASAIDKIWRGPRDGAGGFQWYGPTRGASLTQLAGASPFGVATAHFRYWIHQDPGFDWSTVTESTFTLDFLTSQLKFNAVIGADDPDLSAFRDRGGKLLIWHGFADETVPSGGSIDYYDRLTLTMGGQAATQDFARLFMAPGVAHCDDPGVGPRPQGLLEAVVDWVELGTPPEQILAVKTGQTRPLCPYPQQAVYGGSGSTNDATNFTCAVVTSGCGLGAELALVVPPLWWARSRLRSRRR
jgi:hypothetical protein